MKTGNYYVLIGNRHVTVDGGIYRIRKTGVTAFFTSVEMAKQETKKIYDKPFVIKEIGNKDTLINVD